MALLTGLTADGQEVPVQVKPDGKLVAEGLTGPTGPIGPLGPVGPAGPQGPVGQDQPAGSIIWFAGLATPAGWLYCNGQIVSRGTYAALYAAIGDLYGAGDGTHTFRLPDLRGEFLRGWDDGRGADIGRAMGSYQSPAVQRHNHSVIGIRNTGSEAGGYGISKQPDFVDRVIIEAQNVPHYGTSTEGVDDGRPRNIALRALIRT